MTNNKCPKCGRYSDPIKNGRFICPSCSHKFNSNIENNFMYHSPKEGQPVKYTAIREKAKELAYLIDELCPDSREKSLAITKLEEVSMWANASIARN